MTTAVTHLSRIRTFGDRTITGTLCNRMTGHGDINCSEVIGDVTCKLCLKAERLYGDAASAEMLRRLRSSSAAA